MRKAKENANAAMAPEPRKRKMPPFRGTVSSSATKKTKDVTSTSSLTVPGLQTGGVDYKIQQAKNFAVAQAQQEGCMGNFRIFDSPFGNFLVPVIPTRAELAG